MFEFRVVKCRRDVHLTFSVEPDDEGLYTFFARALWHVHGQKWWVGEEVKRGKKRQNKKQQYTYYAVHFFYTHLGFEYLCSSILRSDYVD